MTIRQKQHLLAYLGYYKGTVDGIWGPLSRSAAEGFQRDWGNQEEMETALKQAVAEGMPQRESGENFWQEIRFFSRKEFACKCGGRYCSGYPAEMKREAVEAAELARIHFGRPAHVVSGLRCPQHNANCGGVANSQHMYGEAIDLYIEGVSADQLLCFVQQLPQIRYAYKINSTNVHFDIPKGAR